MPSVAALAVCCKHDLRLFKQQGDALHARARPRRRGHPGQQARPASPSCQRFSAAPDPALQVTGHSGHVMGFKNPAIMARQAEICSFYHQLRARRFANELPPMQRGFSETGYARCGRSARKA